MSELIMLVGIPASGKTAWAEPLKEKGYHIHSSDAIREELLGDASDQSNNQAVFRELHKRIKSDLSSGISCVYDATNIDRKKRKAFLDEIKSFHCDKTCVVFAKPIEDCMMSNAARDRKVPVEVFDKMLRSFWTPWYYEGWDRIKFGSTSINSAPRGLEYAKRFSQDNPHHSLDLYEHMMKAYGLAVKRNYGYEVKQACKYHDMGKLYTKSFIDSKGKKSDFAHYYGHQGYSAYLYLSSMFCSNPHLEDQLELDKIFYTAALINWHMQPFMAWEQSDKALKKDKELITNLMYEDIMKVHYADLAAH